MQAYPTPVTESVDSSNPFYPRDPHQNTHQMDPEGQPKSDRPLSPPRDQAQPQPPPPPDIEPHNIRELQLAAQLGQDLAGTAALIQGAAAEIAMDAGPDQALRNILPHPSAESEAQHQQVHEAQQDAAAQIQHYVTDSQHHADQMALAMPMALDHHHTASPFGSSEPPPRKRSKVSRACDECRRKKVKCDAQTDTGNAACSSCRRANLQCLFSRIPQKRGPSKGYIKELADRIGSIEQLVQGPGEDRGTKRSFSAMSAGSATATPAPTRSLLWGTEPRNPQPASGPALDRYHTPYSPSDLLPQSELEGTPLARASATMSVRDISSAGSGLEPRPTIPADIYGGYISAIHSYLPFLPESREQMESHLAHCPILLQDAFIESLTVTISSFSSSPAPAAPADVGRAYQKLVNWELSLTAVASSQRRITDLVYVQTLILMVVEADNRPPNAGGPPKEAVIGRAISGALSRRFHQYRPTSSSDPSLATDAEEALYLKTWWVLVVLDRWHAISAGSSVMIHKRDMVSPPGLKRLLGEGFYYLLRFTRILGPASTICSNLQDPPTFPTANEQELSTLLHTWLEEDREELPDYVDPGRFPVVHLAYWHCRLLAYLVDGEASAATLLSACGKALGLLVQNSELASPFNHHLAILTTLCLLELTAVPSRREEALSLLRDFRDLSIAPSAWNSAIKATVEEKLALLALAPQESGSVEKTARESLQRLADVATARSETNPNEPVAPKDGEAPETEGRVGGEAAGGPSSLEAPTRPYRYLGFNPAPILRVGYLTVMREMHP